MHEKMEQSISRRSGIKLQKTRFLGEDRAESMKTGILQTIFTVNAPDAFATLDHV